MYPHLTFGVLAVARLAALFVIDVTSFTLLALTYRAHRTWENVIDINLCFSEKTRVMQARNITVCLSVKFLSYPEFVNTSNQLPQLCSER